MSATSTNPLGARDLELLPKVELHVHLEGTIDATTARLLAERHGAPVDEVLDLQDGAYPPHYRDFPHFLRTFLATTRQVRTPDDLALVAANFARTQAEQHVHYTEVTFTALTHVAAGMEPAAMWQALRDGFAEAPDARIALIVDHVRDLGVDASHRTLRLVADADAPIVALGLTGTEGSVAEREFAHLRAAATELGFGVVVHAGESGTSANIRAAIDDLGADRIAHGIAIVADGALLSRVVRAKVPFDVCPSSNVATGSVPSLEEHPFARMWEAGVNVTVNSDDPPFFGTTLSDELQHVTRLAALTRRDVAELQRRAIRSSFAPMPLRNETLARIDAWDATPSL